MAGNQAKGFPRAQQAAKAREDAKRGPGAPIGNRNAAKEVETKVSNGKVCSGGGNNQAYLLRRMARESPELLERYEKGEFKSVRAAAKEAGIVKDPTPQEKAEKAVSKAPDKPQVILAAWEKCEQKERQAVLQKLASGVEIPEGSAVEKFRALWHACDDTQKAAIRVWFIDNVFEPTT